MSREGLDPGIAQEARAILNQYSLPAQELIKKNLYGPREARLAGAIAANLFTVVVHSETKPTDALRELQQQSHETVTELCEIIRRMMAVIEESVAGQEDLLREADVAMACAEDNIFPPMEPLESDNETKEVAS